MSKRLRSLSSTDPANAIISINLGTAGAFDQSLFPLEYYGQEGNLNKGSFLIRATLEEMEKIRQLGIDLNKNLDFISDTRFNIEALRAEELKLQDDRRSLNPFKSLLNYRAARLFHVAARTVFLQTKSKSETIHRDAVKERVQVVPSTRMQLVDDEVPPDAAIIGLSIGLPDGLNDDAKRTIKDVTDMIAKAADPFNDNPLVSQLREGEQEITLTDTSSLLNQDGCSTSVDVGNRISVVSSDLQRSRPTSPQPITVINVIQNSIVATNSSNLNGLTLNRGDRNSGASVSQEFVP